MRKFKFLLGVILATALCMYTFARRRAGLRRDGRRPAKWLPTSRSPRRFTWTRKRSARTVKFLASDLLEGRGTGQRGGDAAAEYIAAQFALYGLRPVGTQAHIFRMCRWWG